jgi:hypothetical protein
MIINMDTYPVVLMDDAGIAERESLHRDLALASHSVTA